MKHFFLIVNREKDLDGEMTKRIQTYLEQKGARCVCPKETELPEGRFRYTDPAAIPADTDCVIVLGGDGTLIQAARDLVHTGFPLLGINLGTLGYLTEVDASSIEPTLDCLLQGKYFIEERIMVQGSVVRDGKLICEDLALNDIVVSRSGRLCPLRYHVMVDGEPLNDYQADGLIVSTPTGSTAYNMSAGGPVVLPEASLFVMTPVCSHTLNACSIVLPGEVRMTVRISGAPKYTDVDCMVSFDGAGSVSLLPGDCVEIRKAAYATRLLKLSKVSFLETLRRKMS